MRTAIVLIVALAVGAAVGAATGWIQAANPGPSFHKFIGTKNAPFFATDADDDQNVPRVETPEGTEYYFGVMGVGETRSHRFEVRNTGKAPLKLVLRETTCSCTLGELDHSDIPPGGSTYVTLEWSSQSYSSHYKQTAVLTTNDPDHDELHLTVMGTVVPIARLESTDLSFANVPVDTERTSHTVLFAYDRDDLQIVDHQWLDASIAEYFELEVTPDETALQREPNALIAWRCRITVKPGLPLGTFHQRLRLVLNEPRMPELEMSVTGSVVSDLTLTGRDFDKSRNLLMVESLRQHQEAERAVTIYVKGDGHKDVRLSVSEVDPADVLQVELDEPRHLDPVSVHVLRVRIPVGSRPVNRLGSPEHPWGRIELATTHPDIPKLTVYVRFAVIP